MFISCCRSTLTVSGVRIFSVSEPSPALHLTPSLTLAGININPSGLLFYNFPNMVLELLPTCQIWGMSGRSRDDEQEVAISVFPRAGVGHYGRLAAALVDS
jgi:hypothetical protein